MTPSRTRQGVGGVDGGDGSLGGVLFLHKIGVRALDTVGVAPIGFAGGILHVSVRGGTLTVSPELVEFVAIRVDNPNLDFFVIHSPRMQTDFTVKSTFHPINIGVGQHFYLKITVDIGGALVYGL